MKVCIIVDDNSGFTPEEVKKEGISCLKMPIVIDGEEFFQYINIDEKTYFEKLEGGSHITTSQPAIGEVMELWRSLLKEYDEVVHIPMSSGLSNTCDTTIALARDKEFANKVFVVDNHRISITLKPAVKDAKTLIAKGKSGREIKEILEKTAYDSSIYITCNTLKYLKKGGRITPAAALVGEALHIKPVMTIKGGKLDKYKKSVGLNSAKKVMIEAIKNDLETKFKDVPREDLELSFAYTKDRDVCEKFAKEATEILGFKSYKYLNPLSFSLSTHIGPGVLAIALTKLIK